MAAIGTLRVLQPKVLTNLEKQPFENIIGIEENAGN